MQTFVLINGIARQTAQEAVRAARHGAAVLIVPRAATRGQRAKFHAICGDFAKQAIFAGHRRTAKDWKVLLISGHAHATGADVEIVVGLEGEVVNLRESTAQMDVERMSSVIEYAIAHGTELGVKFKNKFSTHA